MEININKYDQLVISGEWDLTNNDDCDKVELLINNTHPDVWKLEINRDLHQPLIWYLETDGYYQYYQINLPKDSKYETPEDIINLINRFGNSVDYNKNGFFSIVQLRKCVLQLEKEAIHNFIHDHKNFVCNKPNDQYIKDILLIAIYVLENLIASERFSEAEIILKSMPTCNILCKNNNIQICNCNA